METFSLIVVSVAVAVAVVVSVMREPASVEVTRQGVSFEHGTFSKHHLPVSVVVWAGAEVISVVVANSVCTPPGSVEVTLRRDQL